MGYKLAGFTVLGGVEIDPDMMKVYRANHNPKFSYLMGVKEFKNIPDSELPPELYNLDILDGSPPCSSFSMSGARDKKWGKEAKFREGQAVQVLDDLFFDYISIADKLRPKIVVAENVKGLIQGKARGYVKEIFNKFSIAGYDCQLFLLNASRMGVPQRRERTFFIAKRKDLCLPYLKLEYNEEPMSVEEAFKTLGPQPGKATDQQAIYWRQLKPGESFKKVHPKGHWFNAIKLHPKQPANTLAAQGGCGGLYHYSECRKVSPAECLRLQTFPDDYDLQGLEAYYLCGMSVPPFMLQRLAYQIQLQWLSGLA